MRDDPFTDDTWELHNVWRPRQVHAWRPEPSTIVAPTLDPSTLFLPDDLEAFSAAAVCLEEWTNPKTERWQADPAAWVRERLGWDPWSVEVTIMETVRDNHDTAVHSCHNIGKSFTAACLACWWIDAHPPGEAFVVSTAPSEPQIIAILWREMNRMHKKAGLIGRMNLKEWFIGNEMVAFGRKPADYDPIAFQGIHAYGGGVLVVLDEACGIPKPLWDAASTLVSNDASRMLAIGNPDDPTGEFSRVCRPDSGWKTIHVGYQHTPNFTGEEVDPRLANTLISPGWVESKKKSWGEGSALYVSKVLGLFPEEESAFTTVPAAWALRCRTLELPEGEPCDGGLDVGAGGDRTVLRERRGAVAGREEIWVDPDPMRQVGNITSKIQEWGLTRVTVDRGGPGWALAGRLRELSSKQNTAGKLAGETTHDAEIIYFNFGGASSNPKRFLNARAELYWEVGRELSRLDAWDLRNVDEDVIAELCCVRYEVLDSWGKIKIELKKDVIKRLGLSPDRAEALLLAYWSGTQPEVEVADVDFLMGQHWDVDNREAMVQG